MIMLHCREQTVLRALRHSPFSVFVILDTYVHSNAQNSVLVPSTPTVNDVYAKLFTSKTSERV